MKRNTGSKVRQQDVDGVCSYCGGAGCHACDARKQALTREERDLHMEWVAYVYADEKATEDDFESAINIDRYEATVRDLEGIVRRLERSLVESERRAQMMTAQIELLGMGGR